MNNASKIRVVIALLISIMLIFMSGCASNPEKKYRHEVTKSAVLKDLAALETQVSSFVDEANQLGKSMQEVATIDEVTSMKAQIDSGTLGKKNAEIQLLVKQIQQKMTKWHVSDASVAKEQAVLVDATQYYIDLMDISSKSLEAMLAMSTSMVEFTNNYSNLTNYLYGGNEPSETYNKSLEALMTKHPELQDFSPLETIANGTFDTDMVESLIEQMKTVLDEITTLPIETDIDQQINDYFIQMYQGVVKILTTALEHEEIVKSMSTYEGGFSQMTTERLTAGKAKLDLWRDYIKQK